MINLTGGGAQSAAGLFVANGSIEFVLNADATVIAANYGQVLAAIPTVFQLDEDGNILPNEGAYAQIWSNLELDPQESPSLLGTWYKVTWYDSNGARLSQAATLWQFTEPANSIVDISEMTSISPSGPYYPVPGGNFGVSPPTIVAYSATPAFVANGLFAVESFQITLTGNVTSSTISGFASGQIIGLQIIQDAFGGHTFVYPTNVYGGMDISTDQNAINTQLFYAVGTNLFAVAPGTIN